MSMEKFADLYRSVGYVVQIKQSEIYLEKEGVNFRAVVDDDWKSSIKDYFKAKQYSFDEKKNILTAYKAIEFGLVRIDPAFTTRSDYEYIDKQKRVVKISACTHEFSLSLMASNVEPNPMKYLDMRLMRKANYRAPGKDGIIKLYKFDDLIVSTITAKYQVPRKIKHDLLRDEGLKAVKASLFKISYFTGECWELREAIQSIRSDQPIRNEDTDNSIPNTNYNDDLIKLYKVARSSIFPNQEFLSYYHILEYFFLLVSDENLHISIKSLINSPSFNSSYENVNKLLSVLKKNDSSSDETEMLRNVLRKYVDEEEFIQYVKCLEKDARKDIFTDTKKKVFGDSCAIRLEKGHALNNAAKVIKHIRNALVHSSDHYNREDCYIPFSESENVIVEFMPIIRFLSERIIFATTE
jgi:hypothetical protein